MALCFLCMLGYKIRFFNAIIDLTGKCFQSFYYNCSFGNRAETQHADKLRSKINLDPLLTREMTLTPKRKHTLCY